MTEGQHQEDIARWEGALHGVHAIVRFKKNLTLPTLSEKRFIANYPQRMAFVGPTADSD